MSALSQSLTFPVYNSTSSVQIVYPNSATNTINYISLQVEGDGYYGSSDGLHTVMYTTTDDFVGTITMQASLATSPVETDWFNVNNTTFTVSTSTYYDNISSSSTVNCYNFTGNFVWVRGTVAINYGTVQSILYNH
jgi:hypothetical protein